MLLSESTRHRTGARSTPDECGHATCARCCVTCKGGVHPTGPRRPPEAVHTGQNAECERKSPFCCVEQMPEDDFRCMERVVSATCSAVSQFNAGIKVTMKNLCDVMQVPSGAHLLASAEKADRRRLQQAKRHTLAASKEARPARFVARTQAAAATSTYYAAGEF